MSSLLQICSSAVLSVWEVLLFLPASFSHFLSPHSLTHKDTVSLHFCQIHWANVFLVPSQMSTPVSSPAYSPPLAVWVHKWPVQYMVSQIKPCWCLVQKHPGVPGFTRCMWWCTVQLGLSLSWIPHLVGQSKWDTNISGAPRKCLLSNNCFSFCLTASVLILIFFITSNHLALLKALQKSEEMSSNLYQTSKKKSKKDVMYVWNDIHVFFYPIFQDFSS